MEYLPIAAETLPLRSFFPASFQPLYRPGNHKGRSNYITKPCGQIDSIQGNSYWERPSTVDRRGKDVLGLAGVPQHCKSAHNSSEVALHPQNHHTATIPAIKTTKTGSLYGPNANKPSEPHSNAEPIGQKASISKATLEDLLHLSELQGSLKAKLKQITDQMNRRKGTIACFACHTGERLHLYTSCGHGVCGKCAEKAETHCEGCGKAGKLVCLAPAATRM